jgi:hypothetical protein
MLDGGWRIRRMLISGRKPWSASPFMRVYRLPKAEVSAVILVRVRVRGFVGAWK